MRKIYSFLVLFFVSFVTYSQEDYCVIDISFSHRTFSAFTVDGKIYTWGRNDFGQIGKGDAELQTSPYLRTEIPQFNSISHSLLHTAALTNDGKVFIWGSYVLEPTEEETVLDSYVPIQMGNDSDWVKVVVGIAHTVALKNDGTIWGWGNNKKCALVETPSVLSPDEFYDYPVQLSPDNDWVDIEAGGYQTFAIKSDGTLWGRGDNLYFALGVPTTTDCVNVFTQIGTDTDWKKVSASKGGGGQFAIALKTDDTLWGWGNNIHGGVGNGESIIVEEPIQIDADTWQDISAGTNHSLGIKTNGTLWEWGRGCASAGVILPLNSPLSPVQVGSDSDWVKVQAAYCSASYALKSNNTIWAWGFYGYGEWGGQYSGSATPVLVFQCAKASVSEHELSNIILYPNPTTDKIFWAQNIVIEKATVFDTNGKQILSENITGNSIDVSHLARGTYLIKLESQDKLIYNSKFVKN